MLADRTAASAGLPPPRACKQRSWDLHLALTEELERSAQGHWCMGRSSATGLIAGSQRHRDKLCPSRPPAPKRWGLHPHTPAGRRSRVLDPSIPLSHLWSSEAHPPTRRICGAPPLAPLPGRGGRRAPTQQPFGNELASPHAPLPGRGVRRTEQQPSGDERAPPRAPLLGRGLRSARNRARRRGCGGRAHTHPRAGGWAPQ